jgi:hypothetical protein
MKHSILPFVVGILLGGMAGLGINLSTRSLFDDAKFQRNLGDARYADIILTIATAHRLGEDAAIWGLIGPYGVETIKRLSDQKLRDEVNDARK